MTTIPYHTATRCGCQGGNDRGVSVTFGPDILAAFLDKYDLDLVLRGHQACLGAPVCGGYRACAWCFAQKGTCKYFWIPLLSPSQRCAATISNVQPLSAVQPLPALCQQHAYS